MKLKRGSTLFLKIVIVLIAIGVLAGLLRFPQTEGVAKNLDLISIYTNPFIIYIYIGSIPFFVGLYQAFKLLNFIDANKAFSQGAVNTLKYMKYASLSLIGFIALALLSSRSNSAWLCRDICSRCYCNRCCCFPKTSAKCSRHKIRE
jgi:hypothetical protein